MSYSHNLIEIVAKLDCLFNWQWDGIVHPLHLVVGYALVLFQPLIVNDIDVIALVKKLVMIG